MRILVVHRARVFADAIVQSLAGQPTISRIDAAYGGVECARALRSATYDIVLLTRSSLTNCSRLRRTGDIIPDPNRKRVVFASSMRPAVVAEALEAGMDGIIQINQSAEDIAQQLLEIHSGRVHVTEHPSLHKALLDDVDLIATKAIIVDDPVDLDIVRLVSKGLSDKEISALLHYSGQTIRNRISRLLRNSGIDNRTRLASIFLRQDYPRTPEVSSS